MLIQHLPNKYEDTLACYDMWEHEDWKDLDEEGNLKGFISYFYLDFKWDMIITAATDNRFSKAQWRILKKTVLARTKPLRVASDPNNKAIISSVERLGGKFFEDEAWFPEPGYSYGN